MSGCDTPPHLFGCEVLIKSESDARQQPPQPPPLTTPRLCLLPKFHLRVEQKGIEVQRERGMTRERQVEREGVGGGRHPDRQEEQAGRLRAKRQGT